MRVVLDANVLVAALLSRTGAPAQLVSRWIAGEFDVVVSESLLADLERTLARPELRSRVAPEDAARYAALLRRGAVIAPDPPDAPARSSDPGDDYLLALAESEQALLVSRDPHLLELADRFPIRTP